MSIASLVSFNSRTLGRVRLVPDSDYSGVGMFQFTHPGKGATRFGIDTDRLILFQFTHPGKGATPQRTELSTTKRFQFTHPGKGATGLVAQMTLTEIQFQFTHPGKGATGQSTPCRQSAPSFNSRTLGRVRPNQAALQRMREQFQFTHPGKGATVTLHSGRSPNSVSIHAPWEGCDFGVVMDAVYGGMFQFTHPGKGATNFV